VNDPFNGYDGFIGIERRGSSSQDFPKKSWGFETWDSAGQDIDVSLLGMPEESDWILNAHYTDKTLMRNVLTYYLSNMMGRYAARTRFCEVVLNGQYWGVYAFMEKIKRDNDRVDIAKLDETDTIAPGLTGGYILKIDKETGSGGEGWDSRYPPYVHNHGETVFFQYDYPEFADLLPLQDEYIRNYVDTFETALYNFTGQAPFTHHNYMDIGSFADFFILNELTRNVDGYRLSTYFHKDREGKVTMGPVWDFDLAWGNANYCEATEPDGWVYMFHTYCPGGEWQQPFWWVRLMQDSIYVNELSCRWEELSRSFLSFDSIHDYIAVQAALLDEGQERNFTKWPILGVWIWPNPWPLPLTYDEEVMNLKLFAMRRLNWLNSNMPAGCKYAGMPEETAEAITIYPNPVKDILHFDLPSSDRKINRLELFNSVGQKLQSVNLWQANSQVDVSILTPGMYFLRVFMADEVQMFRFIKSD
jgi:hypothetical protein